MREKRKILLIENNRVFSSYLRASLELDNFSVTVSRDGISGLRKAKGNKHDLVILDVNQPSVSGFEIINEVEGHNLQVPVFIISNTSFEPSFIEKSIETGISEFFSMPVCLEELCEKIKEYV